MMKTRTHDNKTSGQAILELALVLPLLVLLMVGVIDFSRAIEANNIIVNMSREGANMASRTSMAAQDIMNTLAYTAQSLNMRSSGMMYITVIQGVAGGYQIVPTPDAWSGTTLSGPSKPLSRVPTPTPSNPNPLAPFSLPVGDKAYIVEVFYKYASIFSSNVAKITPTLYSRAIF
jgi:uncharacterized protein (UPF0333 family)